MILFSDGYDWYYQARDSLERLRDVTVAGVDNVWAVGEDGGTYSYTPSE